LGRAIINKKVKDARTQQESGLVRYSEYSPFPWCFSHIAKFLTDTDAPSRLKSVTQEGDLNEFLNNAQLAGTDFTAGAHNLRGYRYPHLHMFVFIRTSKFEDNPTQYWLEL
jgi:large subunit GTPase 1